jgi:pimeloyl-ACP methyl ester carboxylesterase
MTARRMAALAAVLLGLAAAGGGLWAWTPDIPRAALEARHARGPADFITVDGMRLHVRDSGPKDAPPVILLHGFGGSVHTWDAWAEGLQATHRVVRYDQPGAGLSAPDRLGQYTDERGMQVLAALMDQLGLQHASLVGHSMGGRLAWRMAADQPQRVDKLVLVAPDGFASPGFDYGRAPDVGWITGLLRWALPRAVVRASLAPAYADPATMTDALVDRYHALMLAPGNRQALLDRMRQLVLRPPAPFLARIQAPTLLVWGTADKMIPVANAADYQRALPRSQLVQLPGVGHLPQEEAAAASLAAVDAFLRS